MRVSILDSISHSVQIEVEGTKLWIRQDWLIGDELRGRVRGALSSKLAVNNYYSEPKNQATRFGKPAGYAGFLGG